MNKSILIGRFTKDIELRTTDSGLSCVSNFVAVNNGKDKDGNELPADFIKIYIWGKQAENVAKYCKKGSQIAVCGRIKSRSWEKSDGTKGYETYVRADTIQFLDSKPSESVPLPEPDYIPEDNKPGIETDENIKSDPFKDFGNEIELTDDDLPF